MQAFTDIHADQIKGTLSCFDRIVFRGYLPIQNSTAMAGFLNQSGIRFKTLKGFLLENAAKVKKHAQSLAAEAGRPYEYLDRKIRMEERARQLAERDDLQEGLVCVFARLEPCRTFSFSFVKGRPRIDPARRKCLHLYYYFMDRQFGLIHVRVQTWFPMVMQVYVNGNEWLSRKLADNNIGHTKLDNVLVHVADRNRAQAFADRLPSLDWSRFLGQYAAKVNPLMNGLLSGQSYYWVTAQCEFATDVTFRTPGALKELYPRLISHAMQSFGAKEVMSFLGRKLVGQYQGEVVTDLLPMLHKRQRVVRIKHRAGTNWIKMYDKAGVVLRVETVINSPEEFRVRKSVTRKGKKTSEWVPMRKGVHYLFRYRDVSMSANSKYLDQLAVVSDPRAKVRELDAVTRRKRDVKGRTARAFNPVARDEVQLFEAVMDGAHTINGFTNKDIRARLDGTTHFKRIDEDKRSAKVSRILHRFHLHRLIAKIPRSRRWRTTRLGRRLMATALQVRHLNFPQLLALAP